MPIDYKTRIGQLQAELAQLQSEHDIEQARVYCARAQRMLMRAARELETAQPHLFQGMAPYAAMCAEKAHRLLVKLGVSSEEIERLDEK